MALSELARMTPSVHWHTPTLRAHDPRTLPVSDVAYLRNAAGDDTERQTTRRQHDTAGRLVKQWDPRLPVPCLTTVYRLDGEALKTDSVDAGWRLTLPGLAAEPLQRWSERGDHWRTTFDEQLRVLALAENDQPDVDVFIYADATADAGHNLRGQLHTLKDRSGTLHTGSFALSGQPLQERRTFHDDQAFTHYRVLSPLGTLLEQTDAGGHRQRSRYGVAGQLKQVHLQLKGQTTWRPVLLAAQYNAAAQIVEQRAGNDVTSQWIYDPADGRLRRQSAQKQAQAPLQDFEYVYDAMGNITRIDDHAFTPSHFANQRVDGRRDFSYDSLYRLTSASGYDDGPLTDIPGLPTPTDPINRLNYTQSYRYDAGNNLIELKHVRAGANHTQQLSIDPHSNRGVRWMQGQPVPDFDTLFDRHGNQQAVQPGQALHWNARDELTSVTLIHREDGRHDAEHYRYSQGLRVFKRHQTYTANTEHFHQVRYLPGLEIRTRDNGEELHVISVGNARCLHWAQNKPKGVDDDQLRYSLDDHLGSCVMELDQQAQIISHEGYYPFGATAWMLKYPADGIDYKTVRYSGKEMDVSGLYYYGERYYAPWLQRWLSADPAGDVDGLNLYGFVGNNPLVFIDNDGTSKDTPDNDRQDIEDYTKVLDTLGIEMQAMDVQLNNLFSNASIGKRFAVNTAYHLTKAGASTSAAALVSSIAPGVPLVPTIASTIVSKVVEKLSIYKNFSTPILPDPRKINPERLHTEATVGVLNRPLQFAKNFVMGYDPRSGQGRKQIASVVTSTALGQVGVPAASELMAIAQSGSDVAAAVVGLQDSTIDDLERGLGLIIDLLNQDRIEVNAAFARLEINEFYSEGFLGSLNYTYDMFTKNVGTSQGGMIRRDEIQAQISVRIAQANRNLELIGRYRQYNAQRAA
ncbi:RHS repeat-associated core domain-containing protein [Pseudomonas monsensis]|uniref:RHS repeat-associated core domain-containing protein n=1 Tax=Pseudomonas monsensis TaxID=2745509 RepID=UPI002ABC49E5|nr:RHS repeat-associated core domain-containing protein [Pseudomonas monsensis]MDZ3829271.1 RHS repeat-associated core domain-containing protein [Pseudomonas monsensis]